MVFLEKERGLMFTGDVLVNPDGYTSGQKAYNRLPGLLAGGSVNEDSKKAVAERHAVYELMKGREWTICPGHGAVFKSQ
jgi:glyoxylase-like metal-dependent hydrolase (beta-lactamase superfamily II)